MDFELVFGTLRFLKGVTKMITFDSNSRKTTYSDGDSLSGDLGEKVRRGVDKLPTAKAGGLCYLQPMQF